MLSCFCQCFSKLFLGFMLISKALKLLLMKPCRPLLNDLGPADVIVFLPMFLIFIRHSNGISSSSESESLLNIDDTFDFFSMTTDFSSFCLESDFKSKVTLEV